MDPNANLKEQRRVRDEMRALHDFNADSDAEIARLGGRLLDLFEAMDEWLSKGGFLPAAWAKGSAVR